MTATVHRGSALDAYRTWPTPTCIVSDGAYGVAGFDGDPRTPDRLGEWYAPHVAAWTAAATARTSLWFWNTEVGWANVHPVLAAHGWKYVQTVTWDKGIGHIAGNVNGTTIRSLPCVTEVSVLYERTQVPFAHGVTELRDWLRGEWRRTGLPFHLANEACGVKSAATRKYLASDDLWYMPPVEHFVALAEYANRHGDPGGAPYFVTAAQVAAARTVREAALLSSAAATARWEAMGAVRDAAKAQWETTRRVWNHEHGLTNVWTHPALRGAERVKVGGKPVHTNQKPLEFMRRQVAASTLPGDVVWEPFGGLASATVAATGLGRDAYVAESNPRFWPVIDQRLGQVVATADGLAA